MRKRKLLERFRTHGSGRMTAGAIRGESGLAFAVQDGLGHDRARGISGAEKENVVVGSQVRHASSAAAGFRARMKALANLPWTVGAMASTSIPWAARNWRASSMPYTRVGSISISVNPAAA